MLMKLKDGKSKVFPSDMIQQHYQKYDQVSFAHRLYRYFLDDCLYPLNQTENVTL